MFELSIERSFCAAHAIRIGDHMEPVHGHNWVVTATVAGRQLDEDGLLIDFHRVERDLDSIIAPLHNHSLNETAEFASLNPTAEHVAREIGQALQGRLPQGVTLVSMAVTEAPGCRAIWRP